VSKSSETKREAARRAWCRYRAGVHFHVLNNNRRTFPEILAIIRRRWPVSCSGDDFAAELQRRFDAEQAERAEWLRDLARRLFDGWYHPRWTFERFAKYVRLRRPKLAKYPVFAGELRRLYDAAHAADLQPQDIDAAGGANAWNGGPVPTGADGTKKRIGLVDEQTTRR